MHKQEWVINFNLVKITFIHLESSLVKVLDWNLFRVNRNYSDPFRYLYPSQCESFQTDPKNVLYLVWWKTVKNQSDLIRLIPRHQSDQSETKFSIQIILSLDWSKPNFQSESIRMNPRSEWFGLIRVDLDWKLSFGLIRIDVSELIGLSWIDFWPFFIKRDTKRFSDWFGMICIGSDTDIGIVLIDLKWISIRYFRQSSYNSVTD